LQPHHYSYLFISWMTTAACQKLIDILIHALLVLSQLLGGHEETYKCKEDFSGLPVKIDTVIS